MLRARPKRTRQPLAAPEVVDVPPLFVDLHRGLGAVTLSLRDDSPPVLAGIALLVATAVAASGAVLALTACRAERRVA